MRTLRLLVLAGIDGAAPAGFAALVGAAVATLPDAVAAHGFGSPAGHRLVLILVGMGAVLLVQEIAGAVGMVAVDDLYRRFDEYLLGRVLSRCLRYPDLRLFDEPALAATLDRAARVARFGPGELVSGFSSQWSARARGWAAAILLFTVDWRAALAVAAVWVAAARFLRASYYRAHPFWSDPYRRSRYLQRVGLMPEWAKEVRIFGLTEWLVERFSGHWHSVMTQLWQARKADHRTMALVAAAAVAVNAGAAVLIVTRGVHGGLTLGAVVVAAQALFGAAALASQDGDVWIENGAVPIPDVLALEAAMDESPRAAGTEPTGLRPQQEIRLESVHYTYPGRTEPVFSGLDLTIPAGRSLAVVGVNGAGKTTLAKLITGLCRPDAGRITVDGTDLQELDPQQWRGHAAAIFQDFVHFELSVRDNVAFGAVEGRADDEEIEQALHRAGAQEVIEGLPAGLDTPLSRRFTGGVELSGGQWQRIALARALLAVQNGSRLLVMDEPTAHLDVRAEVDLFDRFLELTAGLTTVLISHRFSTVRRADRIVVVDGGRIVESGTHAELVAADGRYAAMFRAQALRYAGERDG